MLSIVRLLAPLALFAVAHAVCDGNPHGWGRLRRCDQQDAACPTASWALNCGLCEGIGGLATSDESSSAATFKAANCTIVATPAQLQAEGKVPVSPIWPKVRSTMRVQHVIA